MGVAATLSDLSEWTLCTFLEHDVHRNVLMSKR